MDGNHFCPTWFPWFTVLQLYIDCEANTPTVYMQNPVRRFNKKNSQTPSTGRVLLFAWEWQSLLFPQNNRWAQTTKDDISLRVLSSPWTITITTKETHLYSRRCFTPLTTQVRVGQRTKNGPTCLTNAVKCWKVCLSLLTTIIKGSITTFLHHLCLQIPKSTHTVPYQNLKHPSSFTHLLIFELFVAIGFWITEIRRLLTELWIFQHP